MPGRLFRLYQRKRVININANVIAAGLGSTAVVVVLIWIIKHPFDQHWPSWGFTLFAFAVDLVLDVTMFTGLHWVANHWRPLEPRTEKEKIQFSAAAPPHIEDTARVQLERAVLSPLYYVIAVAGTEGLQRAGLHPAWAVAIAYPVGLAVTRTIHTVWGLRSGTFHDNHIRAKRRRIDERKAARRAGSRSTRTEA